MLVIHIVLVTFVIALAIFTITSMQLRWRRCSNIEKTAAKLQHRWQNAEAIDSTLYNDTRVFWEETRAYLASKYNVEINSMSFYHALDIATVTGPASHAGDVCDILLALQSLETSMIRLTMGGQQAPGILPSQ